MRQNITEFYKMAVIRIQTRFCIFMFLRVVYRPSKNKKRVVLYIIQSFGCDQAKKRVLARRKRTSLQESGCDSKHDQSSPTHILLISYSCKSALEMYTTRKKRLLNFMLMFYGKNLYSFKPYYPRLHRQGIPLPNICFFSYRIANYIYWLKRKEINCGILTFSRP